MPVRLVGARSAPLSSTRAASCQGGGAASLLVVTGETWTLHRRKDGRLLAELVVTGLDQPWANARVVARYEFQHVRPLFSAELRLLDAIDDDVEPWEHAYDAVLSVVTLRYPHGAEVPEFLLHIDGDEAWWRWSDKPFEDTS
jgi:hypothetical protein